MKEINISKGQVVLVDDEDFEELSKYRWAANWHKQTHSYRAQREFRENGKRCVILMHRQIMKVIDSKIQIDHKDGNSLNNQKYNLRPCNDRQNQYNSKKQSDRTSVYKGVHWDKNRLKWMSRISIPPTSNEGNGRQKSLGRFKLEIDAAYAYNAAAHKYFGSFAKLNYPDES